MNLFSIVSSPIPYEIMGNSFRKIVRTPEFEKDQKKLLKRFPTLEEDLQIFISRQLVLFHKMSLDNKGIFRLTGLGFDLPWIFKAKKFACSSRKGWGVMSGIRVIYAYHPDLDRIDLIEIYFKGTKEKEDMQRILEFCKRRKNGAKE